MKDMRLMKDHPATGKKFGYWTVLKVYRRKDGKGDTRVIARCKCGTKKLIYLRSLTQPPPARSKSCGCYKSASMVKRNKEGTAGIERVLLPDARGRLLCVAEHARRIGVSEKTIHYRLRVGKSTAEALSKHRSTKHHVIVDGEPMSVPKAAELHGLSSKTIYARLSDGVPMERLLVPPGKPWSRRKTIQS